MKQHDPKGQAPNIGFVIATKRITQDEHKVCFLYREEPMDPKDSGWRLFAGDESQEYVDDPENSGIHTPAEILMIDDSILPLLDAPVGAAFEREDPSAAWETVAFETEEDKPSPQHLGGDWWIEIADAFERLEEEEGEEEEGDIVFAGPGRTVRLALWDFEDKTHEEVLSLHQEYIESQMGGGLNVLERFDLGEAHLGRLGFLIEEADDERQYHVLYGFTIVGNEVVQGAYYFDDVDELGWALTTWRSVRALRN